METVNFEHETLHSVTLFKKRCIGCTNCVKRCPVEAIRVRNGKAMILKNKCIDCGECINVCPHHARKPIVDSLKILDDFEYTVALPSATLYFQFKDIYDSNFILTALKRVGFDDVFEVSAAGELISEETLKAIKGGLVPKPAINAACPTVVRLIKSKFPSLIPNLLQYRIPVEFAARWAKKEISEKKGIPREKIGCIYISPCPAKNTIKSAPLGSDKSEVDAVVAISEVYPLMLSEMKRIIQPEKLAQCGEKGLGWAVTGGEAQWGGIEDYVAADGIENVIRVLEAVEDGKIHQTDFIELCACAGGCVGGALCVENPFIARSRMTKIFMDNENEYTKPENPPMDEIVIDKEYTYDPFFQLDSDLGEALAKLKKIQKMRECFKGMDCGACGAPSCLALAGDIVNGEAVEEDCVFVMREKLEELNKKLQEEKGEN